MCLIQRLQMKPRNHFGKYGRPINAQLMDNTTIYLRGVPPLKNLQRNKYDLCILRSNSIAKDGRILLAKHSTLQQCYTGKN